MKGADGNELTVCHYQDVSDTIEMKLSELVEDCRIVRFEDNDSAITTVPCWASAFSRLLPTTISA